MPILMRQAGYHWKGASPGLCITEASPWLQVAREVFNKCLMGELRNKTRILVTNQLQFVSPADTAIFMCGGQIAEIGSYSSLMSRGKSFAQLMSQAEVRWLLIFFHAHVLPV